MSPDKSTAKKKSQGFTDAEKAAMKERAEEAKKDKKRSKGAKKREDGENDILEKIAEMPEPERTMAARLHELIKANAPDLWPKTWYGMPAYANDDGKVICFFQSASKFDSRYATLGFSDIANLDDGTMWPASFALKELNAATEEKITELVKKAVS